jgi:hypothetical protein
MNQRSGHADTAHPVQEPAFEASIKTRGAVRISP